MKKILKTVGNMQEILDMKIGRFSVRHPAITVIAAFIAVPVATLTAVCGLAALVIYPVAASIF